MKKQPKWRLILLVLALWLLPVGLGACGEPEITGVGAEHSDDIGEDSTHTETDENSATDDASTPDDASETDEPSATDDADDDSATDENSEE